MANPQTLLDGAFARRLERLTLVSRKRLIGQGQGDRRSLRKGSSLEFADYRHYVEGDDPARVDWNIYSRTDTLFVRLYEEEEVLNVHLVLDASRSMDWGEPSKLRYARRVAAALAYLGKSAQSAFCALWRSNRVARTVATGAAANPRGRRSADRPRKWRHHLGHPEQRRHSAVRPAPGGLAEHDRVFLRPAWHGL